MKKFLMLIALPASLAAQTASDAGLKRINLQDAIALAQQNEPAAIAARGAIVQNRSAVRSSYAALMPSLNWSMNQSQSAGPRFGPNGQLIDYVASPWSYGTGLNSTLTLFDGGTKLNTI